MVIGYCDKSFIVTFFAYKYWDNICRDPRSGSINIHDKQEKNLSEKHEVVKPPRVFTRIFLEIGVNIM